MVWQLWTEFRICPVCTQCLLCAVAIVVVAGLTAVSIVLALHPAGVAAVLAFLSGIVMLLLSKNKHTPPGKQAQSVYSLQW